MNPGRLGRSVRLALLLPLALLAPAVAGCLGGGADDAPVDVLATFYPLGFLAQRIGGDNVSVGLLVPNGIEPHEWEPSPPDLVRFSGAKVVLAQGRGMEPWLDALARNAGASDRVVVTTAGMEGPEHGDATPEGTNGTDVTGNETGDARTDEGIELHEEDGHGAGDPHTWLDPVAFAWQARAVERALAAAWPEHAPAFAARLATLEADLEALHAEYEAGLATCERRIVIANHDAYGHLAERYGFEVESVTGLSPEEEPDPRTVARLVDLAREHNVTVVYFEELASPAVIEAIAREVGATTRVLSPIEGIAPEAISAGADYVTLMRANLEALRAGMSCA